MQQSPINDTTSSGSTPVTLAAVSTRYGLPTWQVSDDAGGVSGGRTTIATSYTGGGLDLQYGLPTATTIDPAGLNLTTRLGYEAPSATTYLRRTSRALPSGQTGDPNRSTTTTYYGDQETRDNPCPGGATGLVQAGMPKTVTQPKAADGSQIVEETVYDNSGRIVAARNVTDSGWTCMSYDTRGRVITITTPAFGSDTSPRTTTMAYSAGGDPRVTTTTNMAGTMTAVVDLLGRTTSYTDTAGVVTATSYDLAGRVTTVTTTVAGVASTVGYTWRDDGQMTAITLDGVAVATLAYDPAGELAGVTYPFGGLGALTKQPSGALVGDTWTVNLANGASRTFAESLTRSQAGRVTATSWTDTGSPGSAVGWGYSYDQAGRLTQAVLAPAAGRPQASFGYSFTPTEGCGADPQAGMNGSRTGSSIQIGAGAPAVTSYCYDQASRLTSTTGANPIDPGTVSYDLHGNATRIGDQTWTYDGADQVTGTTVVSTGQQLVYTRDSSGRLVQRQATGPETATARYGFAGGDDSPDLLLNAAGQPLERYLSLPGGVLLTKPATSPITRWAVPNLHGDTSILIGITNGAVTVTGAGWINDPYGQPINPNTGQIDLTATPTTRTGTGTTDAWLGQHQRGYEHTSGLNQMLMGARTYLPTLGIFTATDPVEGGNDTTYGYPNDPINKQDLSGCAPSVDPETDHWLRQSRRGAQAHKIFEVLYPLDRDFDGITPDGKVGRFYIEIKPNRKDALAAARRSVRATGVPTLAIRWSQSNGAFRYNVVDGYVLERGRATAFTPRGLDERFALREYLGGGIARGGYGFSSGGGVVGRLMNR